MLPTTDHLIAAEESSAAAWEVLPLFEQVEQHDDRPRKALEALTAWMKGDATIAHAPHAIRYAQKAMAHVVS